MNHSGFLPSLRLALEMQGITFDDQNWNPSNEQLANTLACYVSFYDVIRHPWRIYRLVRKLRRHRLPLITWNRDAPHYLNYTLPRRRWMLSLANRLRLLDIYATHTLIDKTHTFSDLVVYLPNAVNAESYNLGNSPKKTIARLRDNSAYHWDVTFFGGMNGSRYKEDKAREVFFNELRHHLDQLNISHCFRETDGMTEMEQVQFIQSSRINLNFGARCEYNAPIASGLPERCYGIPACGGFLLCDKRTHAHDDFTPGENWAEFDGLNDCVEKIQYWLSHFDEARALAERCHAHVLNHHTYTHRAMKLLSAIQSWHDGMRGIIK